VPSRGWHSVEVGSIPVVPVVPMVPVVPVVPVSAVAVVLSWVVVGRVGLRRWRGWRIKADDTAAEIGRIVIR